MVDLLTKTGDTDQIAGMGKSAVAPREKQTSPARVKKELQQAAFLKALAKEGIVSLACDAAGVGRGTPYAWREQDESFAAAWDVAYEQSIDLLEAEARRRAFEGVKKPVFRGGQIVGEVTEFSDRLLEFLLNGRRRAVFGKDAAPVVVNNVVNRIELVPAKVPGDDAKVIDGKKADTTRTQKADDDETQ